MPRQPAPRTAPVALLAYGWTPLCTLILALGACVSEDSELPPELPAEPAQRERPGELEGASTPELAQAPPQQVNPLGGLERPPEGVSVTLEGRVEERLEAGSYTYMKISDEGEGARWLVTMGPGAEPGVHITATSVGLQRGFHSRRLERDFDELHFVTLAGQTH